MISDPSYGYTRRLPATPYAEAVQKVRAALQEQGFGILTEIDVQATLKKKLDVDFRPYVILGACNPRLAHQALQGEPLIGLLLPCNVVVAQEGQGSVVSVANPREMFRVVDNDAVAPVADQADRLLRAALDAL